MDAKLRDEFCNGCSITLNERLLQIINHGLNRFRKRDAVQRRRKNLRRPQRAFVNRHFINVHRDGTNAVTIVSNTEWRSFRWLCIGLVINGFCHQPSIHIMPQDMAVPAVRDMLPHTMYQWFVRADVKGIYGRWTAQFQRCVQARITCRDTPSVPIADADGKNRAICRTGVAAMNPNPRHFHPNLRREDFVHQVKLFGIKRMTIQMNRRFSFKTPCDNLQRNLRHQRIRLRTN